MGEGLSVMEDGWWRGGERGLQPDPVHSEYLEV